MSGKRLKAGWGFSSVRARRRVLAVSSALLACALVCFAFAVSGVFERVFVVKTEAMLAPLLGESGADGTLVLSSEPAAGEAASDSAESIAEGDVSASGSLSFFSAISLPDMQDVVARQQAAKQDASSKPSDTGSGGDGGSGGSGTPSDGGSPDDAGTSDGGVSQPADPGVSEAQEQAYLQALRANYDALGGYYQRVVAGWQEFLQVAPVSTEAQRDQGFSSSSDLSYEAAVAHSAISDLQVPPASRYYGSYQTVLQLNHDIDSAAALLRQAWGRCLLNPDDPNDWMTPFNANSANGKITFISDFEARYPGARP